MRRGAVVLLLMVTAAAVPVVRGAAKGAPAGAAAGPGVRADFNDDGFADLAVGTPSEDLGATVDAGAVMVLSGSAAGLTGTGSRQLTQDTPGVPGSAEAQDGFGESLAAGDYNGNGTDDLAVGAPGEDVGAAADAGAVNVLPGSVGGLTGTGSQQFTEDTAGVPDTVEGDDMWGEALTAATP